MLHIGFDFICVTNIPGINHRCPPTITIMVVDDYSVCILNVNYRNFVLHVISLYWEQHYSNVNLGKNNAKHLDYKSCTMTSYSNYNTTSNWQTFVMDTRNNVMWNCISLFLFIDVRLKVKNGNRKWGFS